MSVRFMGLKKGQWIATLGVAFALSIVVQAYTVAKLTQVVHQLTQVVDQNTALIHKNKVLALEGVHTHTAVCQYKADLDSHVKASERFLKLTHQKIIAEYGQPFAVIPKATIENQLDQQQAEVASLKSLHCS